MLEALYLPLRMWLNTLLFLNHLFTKNKKCIKTKTDALRSRLYNAVWVAVLAVGQFTIVGKMTRCSASGEAWEGLVELLALVWISGN